MSVIKVNLSNVDITVKEADKNEIERILDIMYPRMTKEDNYQSLDHTRVGCIAFQSIKQENERYLLDITTYQAKIDFLGQSVSEIDSYEEKRLLTLLINMVTILGTRWGNDFFDEVTKIYATREAIFEKISTAGCFVWSPELSSIIPIMADIAEDDQIIERYLMNIIVGEYFCCIKERASYRRMSTLCNKYLNIISN